MTILNRVRHALGDSVSDLEATVARPPIIREAEVWSEAEKKEVDAVLGQINLLVAQRNRAIRNDLVTNGERASDAVKRLQGKKVVPEAPDVPRGPRWDAMREAEAKLAAKDIILDPLNYEAMKRELERREIEDAEALDKALREANDADTP